MRYSKLGGQAVIEGVMMKHEKEYSVAVRKPDGGIEVTKKATSSYAACYCAGGWNLCDCSISYFRSIETPGAFASIAWID